MGENKLYKFSIHIDNITHMRMVTIVLHEYQVAVMSDNYFSLTSSYPTDCVFNTKTVEGSKFRLSFPHHATEKSVWGEIESNVAIIRWSEHVPPSVFDGFLEELHALIKPKMLWDSNGANGRSAALQQVCPALALRVSHPVTLAMRTLQTVIISLNDSHKWPRSEIADWLETLDMDIEMRGGRND